MNARTRAVQKEIVGLSHIAAPSNNSTNQVPHLTDASIRLREICIKHANNPEIIKRAIADMQQ